MGGSSRKKKPPSPALYVQDDIRWSVPKAIFPIVFFGSSPPTASWYDIKDPNLVRMDRDLITSIFFPEGIDGRRNWNRCLVGFEEYTIGFSTNVSALQRPLPNMSHPNPVYHYSGTSDRGTNVRSGWMFRYDAMFIRYHVITGSQREAQEEAYTTKWKGA